MKTYERDEIISILKSLSESGLDIMIPDTEVQYYSDGVRCGSPTETPSNNWDVVWLPKEMLGSRPTFMVRAIGDSMCDANIYPGDDLTVEITSNIGDGDTVIATIDGCSTAKTLFTDKEGRKWLLPHNEEYNPIPLTDAQNIQINCKVLKVTHNLPRTSYSECARILYSKLAQEQRQESLSAELVEEAVRAIMPMIKNSRQWYSVFRVLVDKEFYHITDMDKFQKDIDQWCPDCIYQVNAYDLSKMAVRSFRKSISQWNSMDAPVKGKYYMEYLLLARTFSNHISDLLARQRAAH